MTKTYVNGSTHSESEVADATEANQPGASDQFAELTLVCLMEEQDRCKKLLESQLDAAGLVDWKTLLLQWLERFSGIEQELSHVGELPFCQVVTALQTRWSTNRELAQRLSKLDFLTWRFQSTNDGQYKWDFREQTLIEFKFFHGPWTAYQSNVEFPECADTEDWLLGQLQLLSERSAQQSNDTTP
jgi:hypothetical protein